MVVERCVGFGAGPLEVPSKATECFGGAKEGVCSGFVAYLFPPNGVLLVGKFQSHMLDSVDGILIIQRHRGALVDHSTNGEVDVSEEEGLTPRFRLTGFEVF